MMSTSIGLRLQTIPRVDDQILAAGHLVASRETDRTFSASGIRLLMHDLRVPEPGGVTQSVQRLVKSKFVRPGRQRGKYLVTPLGEDAVGDLLAGHLVPQVEAALAAGGSAVLSGYQHPLIPPQLAPSRFAPSVARLLKEFPFERNVFVMTRFPRDEPEQALPDPIRAVLGAIRQSADEYGLHIHLASDRSADDDLFGNIAAHMWACKFGIGLFETRYGASFNDNLQIEVGGMLITGRRCLLLKDIDTPSMPTDFVGQIYAEVDFDDEKAVKLAVDRRFADDLEFGSRAAG